MDQPIVNEASFTAANPASYSLSEIWPFTMAGTAGDPGGLGLRMGSLGGFDGDAAAPAVNHGDVSVAESTVTEQSGSRGGGGCGGGGGRKRKDVNSEDESSKLVSSCTANDLNYESNGKRMKASGLKDENGGSKAEAESSSKSGNKPTERSGKPEPPKDYIHVRARRGQATDSHSLAERARREKISERMKILQDLVPGCNKVIGKAFVLDEIINYIQALQHQVEFLSMKLEAVNSRMTPAIEISPPKDVGAPPFDTAGVIFGSQPHREYSHGTQPEWLHMQIGGSSFGRAT